MLGPLGDVETLAAGLEYQEHHQVDAVLLDLNLPDSEGLQTVKAFRAGAPLVPIVVFTGLDDLDTAVETLRRGADDYISKTELTPEMLRRTVAYAVERRNMMLRLERAVRSREDVLNVVSHDLRNHLSTMVMALPFMRADSPKPATRTAAFERFDRALQMMNRLIADLMDMAALEKETLSIRPEALDIAALLDETLKAFAPNAEKRGIRLTLDHTATGARLFADRVRVAQVLGNLVSNALRFTPAGGSIQLSASLHDEQVQFIVKDSGPGVSHSDQARIFERFFRGSSPQGDGLGLGLSIAQGLVTAHGGRMWLESEPGQGATFGFTLPLAV